MHYWPYGRTCDHEVPGLNLTRGWCVPTPTQRAIPIGGRLMSIVAYGIRAEGTGEGLVRLTGALVYLSYCTAGPTVRYRGQ